MVSEEKGEMAAVIKEVDPRKSPELVEEVARLEKKIFPKHESLSRSFHEELKKKNSGLLLLLLRTTKSGTGKGKVGEVEEEEKEEAIGYVMYSWVSSLCASITKLAVKENHRRHGHGETLLKEAIKKCRTRNIQRVCLHVDPTRTAAVSLYQKLGFQIDDLIECYYSSDRNAYRMYLEFGC